MRCDDWMASQSRFLPLRKRGFTLAIVIVGPMAKRATMAFSGPVGLLARLRYRAVSAGPPSADLSIVERMAPPVLSIGCGYV
jgi:hypothetical protein